LPSKDTTILFDPPFVTQYLTVAVKGDKGCHVFLLHV
jgi:hypothetical protein